MVVNQQLVGEAAQVDAQAGREADGGPDPGHVREAADDRLLSRPLQALLVS
jgi:hypothetical protein